MRNLIQFLVGLSCLLAWASPKAHAQLFETDTLLYQGSSEQYINLVVMGDGFTASQIPNFNAQASSLINYLFNTVPFSHYKKYFNVFTIQVVSDESGIKHPGTAFDCTGLPVSNPTNYFSTTFDYAGIHRLLAPDNSVQVLEVISSHFPDFDQGIILANSTEYGGSGGSISVTSLNSASREIMIHELGHSFGLLADEYWAGMQYAHECANMTANNNPATIRWKPWLTSGTGISINQFTGFNWYKPTELACKMELLNTPFCAVCKEALIERIHSLVWPVRAFSPDTTATLQLNSDQVLKLDLIKPSPNTLKTTWKLDGQLVSLNNDSIKLLHTQLGNGLHTVVADVIDTTSLVRTSGHVTAHIQRVVWTINRLATGIAIEQTATNSLDLQIYPNPGRDRLTIRCAHTTSRNPYIMIYTTDGKKVAKIDLKPVPGTEEHFSMETHTIAAGLYRVHLVDGAFHHLVTWNKE